MLIGLMRSYYQRNLYLLLVCEKGREVYCWGNGREMALVNVNGVIFISGRMSDI